MVSYCSNIGTVGAEPACSSEPSVDRYHGGKQPGRSRKIMGWNIAGRVWADAHSGGPTNDATGTQRAVEQVEQGGVCACGPRGLARSRNNAQERSQQTRVYGWYWVRNRMDGDLGVIFLRLGLGTTLRTAQVARGAHSNAGTSPCLAPPVLAERASAPCDTDSNASDAGSGGHHGGFRTAAPQNSAGSNALERAT